VRAAADDADALRHAKLSELHMLRVLRLRDDHARLMHSRAFPSTKAGSVDEQLRNTVCPCGQGVQSRSHLLWHCQIPRVVMIRQERLLPACLALSKLLDGCEPVSGTHVVARACCVALEQKRGPRSGGAAAVGGAGEVLSDEATATAAERHVLGVIMRPYSALGLARALRCARPMLVATALVVQKVFARHRLHQTLRAHLYHVRRVAFEDRECLPSRQLVQIADVRRTTPRLRASTITPTVPVSMVYTVAVSLGARLFSVHYSLLTRSWLCRS